MNVILVCSCYIYFGFPFPLRRKSDISGGSHRIYDVDMGNITFVFFSFYDFVSRETMERCSALYAEVQRSVGRLARVCERRKAQLEKHLPSPPTPPASNNEDCDGVVDDDARIDNGNSPIFACRQVGNRKTKTKKLFHLRRCASCFIDLEKNGIERWFLF